MALTVALAAINRSHFEWKIPMRADSFIAVPNAAWAAGCRRFEFYDEGAF